MPDQLVHDLQRTGPDSFFVMLRTEKFSNFARVPGLVEFLFFESDRTGGYRPLHEAAHGTDNRGRIDAAAQEGAQGHVAHQAHAGCFAQFVPKQLAPFILGTIFQFGEREIPITNFANIALRRNQIVARPNFASRAIDGLRRRNIAA